MRMPDFFIIGAPKCGTTAIYSYLRDRPDVFMPTLKEPHYFSFDLPGRRDVTDEQDYLGLFADAPRAALVGEASASYLFSEAAVPEIIRLNPKARMIAILRNPVDAAHSFHSERIYNLSENVDDFEEAWNLQEARLQGLNISRYCREAALLQYRRVYSFAAQIARLFKFVPKDQRLVCLLEDFKNDPRQVYLAILDFLGLSDDGRRQFPAANASKALRSRRLAEWQRSLRSDPSSWYQKVESMANVVGLRPHKLISRINVKRQARQRLDPRFRRQLAEEFSPDVHALECLLERRLDCWRDFGASPCSPVMKAS